MKDSAFSLLTLHIGEQACSLAVHRAQPTTAEESLDGVSVLALALGSVKTSNEFFRPYPPRPLNLENAIAAVEDELSKLRHLAAGLPRPVLQSSDESVRQIALACGVGSDAALSVDAVERAFNDLVALSSGGRSAFTSAAGMAAPWAADPHAGAVLLILREFMHPMKFDALQVVGANN